MGIAEDSIVVAHETGLHARPASKFVQTASSFDSTIQVRKDDNQDADGADAKSSIGIISLGVEPGDEIHITAEGHDSNEAVARLIELVENDFEQDEEE